MLAVRQSCLGMLRHDERCAPTSHDACEVRVVSISRACACTHLHGPDKAREGHALGSDGGVVRQHVCVFPPRRGLQAHGRLDRAHHDAGVMDLAHLSEEEADLSGTRAVSVIRAAVTAQGAVVLAWHAAHSCRCALRPLTRSPGWQASRVAATSRVMVDREASARAAWRGCTPEDIWDTAATREVRNRDSL